MMKFKCSFLSITLSLLTCLASCSAPTSTSRDASQSQSMQKHQNVESQSISPNVQKELNEGDFLEKAKGKGLDDWQLKVLGNLGFLPEDILVLSDEKIAIIFAPGTQLDGATFIPAEEQVEALEKLGIDIDMSIILFNLGYEYDDMLALTPTEIDFIFPNTELVSNLVNAGFKREDVINSVALWEKGKENYKEVIKEALQR